MTKEKGGKPHKTPSLEEPSFEDNGTSKYQNFHQWHEAYQKKGGGKPHTTPSLKEPSPAITACVEMEAAYALHKARDTLCLSIKGMQHLRRIQ